MPTKLSILIFGLLISALVNAESLWDLRAIANQQSPYTNLKRPDGSTYMTINNSQAKMIKEIADKFSLQSGIYPSIKLRESSEINAMAGNVDGSPTIIINKGMLDVVGNDSGMASALLGHEMGHLYLKHNESSATNQAIGNAIALIAGIALEILAERKLGVTNLGINAGSALGTVYVATYSREQEREADKQGAIWAMNAGYDPNGAIRLFTVLENKSGNSLITFFQTHPNPGERVENAKQLIASYRPSKTEVKTIVTLPPELVALNKAIDEERALESPKSEAAKNGISAFIKKDYADAKKNFEICAAQNEAICQNNLGVLYQNGFGVEVDKTKAVSYYKLASNQNLALAKTNYGAAVARGEDGAIDEIRILTIFKEASVLGSPTAMGTLAAMSQAKLSKAGEDILPSKPEIVNYAKASAMRGTRDGLMALGAMHRTGFDSVEKNTALAETYLTQAANKGDQRANGFLYLLYKEDLSDESKAEAIKTKIVSNKQTGAMIFITSKYCVGNFFTVNKSQCFEWAKSGAYAGSLALGRAYGIYLYTGMSVSADPIEGGAWVIRAKNKGDQLAAATVEKNISKISTEDLAKMTQRADEIDRQIAAGIPPDKTNP